jgi:hypothetical protein
MIKFELEGKRVAALPGSYKGKRRTWRGRVEKVRAECGFCPWKSNLVSARKAETAWLRHMELMHPEGR